MLLDPDVGDDALRTRLLSTVPEAQLEARNRTSRLADLLTEVENDLGFSVRFQQPGERVDRGEVCALLAAVLAHGCDLDICPMEKVAPDIAYRRLGPADGNSSLRRAKRPSVTRRLEAA